MSAGLTQAIDALKTNNSFKQIGVALRDERPSNETLGRAAERLTELVGDMVIPLEQEISKAAAKHFPRFQHDYGSLAEKLSGLGLAGSDRIRTLNQDIADVLFTDASDAPQRLGAETSAIYDNLKWALEVKLLLDNGLDATLRDLQAHRRDIEALPDTGVPGELRRELAEDLGTLSERLGKEDFYKHTADFNSQLTHLKGRVRDAVITLEPSLLGPKLRPLQKRLDDMLTQQGLDAQVLAQRVRLVHAGKRRLKLKAFELVAKATLERKQLSIHHFNRQTGEKRQREISPQQLVHYRDNWYVDAWCHLRKEVRSFSVDAITDCTLIDKPSKELNPDQLRAVMQGGYGIFGGEATDWAKLKFTPQRARWVKREEWHPKQKATELADGSYVLEIPYADERELIGDLLKFGADVEVMGPPALRATVKKIVVSTLALYR